ncbi:MAG: hypothetical protein JSV05_01540 [Candidatus Bathyarchaeota archaeon]|nr:MAG: hypothetical protein JSV05_01540 [Candidatus Bathyarchaeota archaeon]
MAPGKKVSKSIVLICTILLLSCSLILVQQVKADIYNQIPLWINIVQGADVSREQIDEIEKTMDDIFKANGLNWRVTSVIVDDSHPDPDSSKDNPGDVREGAEEDGLYDKGKKETKNLGGFKIFVVNRILNGSGHDVGYLGGAKQDTHTAVVAGAGSHGNVSMGETWAHEVGHLFGLGHEKQNGTDRPKNDLMYPYSDSGTNLQDEDISTMNKTKKEQDLGVPTMTDEQRQGGVTTDEYRDIIEDTYYDSLRNYTDIQDTYFGFYILNETRELHITTFLGDLIPEGMPILYQVGLDVDNDPTTGGLFKGWMGIDFIVSVEGFSPIVTGTLFVYEDPPGTYFPISGLDARVQTQFQFLCRTNDSTPTKQEPILDSIVANIPLELIESYGPLTDPIGTGLSMESGDGGLDFTELMPVTTSPPERPGLDIDPIVAAPGTLVTATGIGFTPTNSVSLIFNHITVASATVELDGSFETSFTVPELPSDHYVVDAIDESNIVGITVFTITMPEFPWDVTGDGYVGIDDVVAVAEHFGSSPASIGWDPKYDINKDDYVGIDDIVAVAEHFGESG